MSANICPHCGKDLTDNVSVTHTFKRWASPSLILLISLMLFAFDLTADGNTNAWGLEWAHWASFGIWLIYITTQLLRSAPNYGWVIVPLGGILASAFFFMIDRVRGDNAGYLGLDWAWWVIIPIMTFLVFFPIIAHYARDEVTHLDQLETLVESLSVEAEKSE